MTLLEAPDDAEAQFAHAAPLRRDRRAAASHKQAVAQQRWGWSQTLVIIIAALGVGILVYPSAASWLSAMKHDTDVSGYVQSIENLPDAEVSELLDAAREYNKNLPAGPLRDPYALGADGQQTAVGGGTDVYFDTLSIDGSETMARVRIRAIDSDLPVFHGTDDETLARGVGHLFGSSLPVGGPNTHAVLTGHSGYVQSTLFDNLKDVELGDTIIVSVLGEDLYYEVDQIDTVLPNETDQLRQMPGQDLITLVTCTPTGVNTHRLLVRAERVDAPVGEDAGTTVIPNNIDPAGFPWWAVALVGVPLVAFLIIKPRRRRQPRRRVGNP
ncbi:class C sortase [Microbacterium lacus]|uniref:class C sortase n=1 Tax=Microbacterium lacus TaxID=415217 RepID=UPI0038505897